MEEDSHEIFPSSSLPPEQFVVDDLLVDFSNENDDEEDNDAIDDDETAINNTNCKLAITLPADADADNNSNSNSASSSSAATLAVLHDGSSFPGDDLCVPCDDLAELEWLSNFVEDSFTTEDVEKLQLISGFKTRPGSKPDPVQNPNPSPIFNTDVSVPAKARSKRPRAAVGNWASRGILLESSPPPYENPFTGETILSSHHLSPPPSDPYIIQPYQNLIKKQKKKDEITPAIDGGGREERRCLHCATDKTPQWRTGPMGPKTLCNACGVRYKSGRLVPEYRPAASPTFVLTKHSNSHRKVMELRRQKEMSRAQHEFIHHHHHHASTSMIFDDADDYLIHHNVGPSFTNMV